VVADDVKITREGIVRMLEDAGVQVVAEAEDAGGLMREVRLHRPDAVVVDIRMPPTHTDEGLMAAAEIRDLDPKIARLVLSQYVEPDYALQLVAEHPEGAGYLLKERVFDAMVLVDALRRLVDGETVVDPTIVSQLLRRRHTVDPLGPLTPREREVLAHVAEGLSNKGIAFQLGITERTVEAHITQTFDKLGLPADTRSHRRVIATLTYLRSGAADPVN
jgi:DNA-binding NarL/FixJ family response regulator